MKDDVSYLSSIFFTVWGKEGATADPLRKHSSLGFFSCSLLGLITPFGFNYILAFGDPT